MARETTGLTKLRVGVYAVSLLNLILAVNFFPLVPLLGWLNFGHANWATAWIPDVVMLVVLPAAYFIYWHFGLLVAGAALAGALYLHQRARGRPARTWALLNGATMVMYAVVRIVLALQGIHPDIV